MDDSKDSQLSKVERDEEADYADDKVDDDAVKRVGSVKKCLQSICTRRDVEGERDSYTELMEGEERVDACKLGMKRCTAVWWKVFVMIGAVLLLAGVICLATTFFILSSGNSTSKDGSVSKGGGGEAVGERRRVGRVGSHRDYRQSSQDMEAVKLLGLILFCIGGLTVAVALMIPSFLYRHFEVDDKATKEFIHNNETSSLIDASKKPSSTLTPIPANQSLAEVQPSTEPTSSQGRPNKAFR